MKNNLKAMKYFHTITYFDFLEQEGSGDFENKENIKNPFGEKSIEELYNEQKTRLIQYIKSPIYREILKKEIEGNQNYIQKKFKYKNNEELESYTNEVISDRLKRVYNSKLIVKKGYQGKANIENGKVKIGRKFEKDGYYSKVGTINQFNFLIPIHELTHVSTKGEFGIRKFSIQKLKKSTTTKYTYFKDPTEIHARLTSIKYLAHTLLGSSIYNAFEDEFTSDTLSKLKSHSWVHHEHNLYDLLNNIYPGQEDTLIEMANLIAEIENNKSTDQDMG